MSHDLPVSKKEHKTKTKKKSKDERIDQGINASMMLLDVVAKAANAAQIPFVKDAIGTTLKIFEAIQKVKGNQEGFLRVGEDASGIISAIYYSYEISANKEQWPPQELRKTIEELIETLGYILDFIEEKTERSKFSRFLSSFSDQEKIVEFRERLKAATDKFEIFSHITLHEMVGLVLKQQKNEKADDQTRPPVGKPQRRRRKQTEESSSDDDDTSQPSSADYQQSPSQIPPPSWQTLLSPQQQYPPSSNYGYPSVSPPYSPPTNGHMVQNPVWSSHLPSPLPFGIPYASGHPPPTPGAIFMGTNNGNVTTNNISNVGNTNNITTYKRR